MSGYQIQPLGSMHHLETKEVLRKAVEAGTALGELKGFINTVPNKAILLNTLPLQEARASSEIENIVTTQDELFLSQVDDKLSPDVKEVRAHADSLLKGYELVKKKKQLRLSDILTIQEILLKNRAGMRTQQGTVLRNNTGEIVYTPPAPQELPKLMDNLVQFINDEQMSSVSPLVKMAIIHHQFESVHPFYDGNGRTGRIINLLYLTLSGLLDLPVLYLSRYIIENKADYYRLLQAVRNERAWQEWILFMLEAVQQTAEQTIELIKEINKLLSEYKHRIRKQFPKMYSQDLINALFSYPYAKIEFIMKSLGCTRPTAYKYLKNLSEAKFLYKVKLGRSNYYINHRLVECLINVRKFS